MLSFTRRRAHSGSGALQLHVPETELSDGLHDENAVETDDLKDFTHMAAGPQHRESMTGLAGVSVERNKGGKTCGINALHGGEIERHVFADDRGREFLKKALLLTANELIEL